MTGRRIVYGLVLLGSAAFWIYYDGRVSVYLFAAHVIPAFGATAISMEIPERTEDAGTAETAAVPVGPDIADSSTKMEGER